MDDMHITRPFMSGRSESVRIPKEYRIGMRDVCINKVGNSLIITPVDELEESFFKGLNMFSDDFLSEGRPDENDGSDQDLSLDMVSDAKEAM